MDNDTISTTEAISLFDREDTEMYKFLRREGWFKNYASWDNMHWFVLFYEKSTNQLYYFRVNGEYTGWCKNAGTARTEGNFEKPFKIKKLKEYAVNIEGEHINLEKYELV